MICFSEHQVECGLDAMLLVYSLLENHPASAVLLYQAQAHAVSRLATDDTQLARACQQVRISPETPIDATLREKMAQWERMHLPAKGLSRILRQVHNWLNLTHPEAAQEFWARTSGGSHLP
jgi:hypothetical protein